MTGHLWQRNGDHPGDWVGQPVVDLMTMDTYRAIEGQVVRFYRTPPHMPGFEYSHPETLGDGVHDACQHRWHDHGWIDSGGPGFIVCPGDYIVRSPHGDWVPVPADRFEVQPQ